MKRTLQFVSLSSVVIFGLLQARAATRHPAENLSKPHLQSLIATAKTPAEHERIARYYEAKAQNDLAAAREHAQMAAQFRQNALTASSKWSTGTVNHCVYFAQSLTSDAAKMQQLALQHEQMALRAGGR